MTKEELNNRLKKDKFAYSAFTGRNISTLSEIKNIFLCNIRLSLNTCVKVSRLCGYYHQKYNQKPTNCNKWIYLWYLHKKNRYNRKLGVEIEDANNIGGGLFIAHAGGTYIYCLSRLGENLLLRGNNCIGSTKDGGGPTVGSNVDMGVGAKVIGDIFIADGIIIGAGAVVVSSFFETGITVAGVPAKKIK